MMNEKIIKYFADEMNSSEKAEFEKSIGNSFELQKEIAKYRDFFSKIKETNNPDVDEDYFVNLIPNFRDKLEQSKREKYRPAFSFAAAVLTVAVVLFFIPRSDKIIRDESLAVNYTSSEISDYLANNLEQPLVNDLSADVESDYDSLLDGIIYDELNKSDQNLVGVDLFDNLDYATLVQSVGRNDAGAIYEQLKNKKFF